MATRTRKACFYHGDRPAVTFCEMCHRPLCSECRKSIGEADFCSESCASRYQSFKQRYVKRQPSRRVTTHGSFVKLLLLVIVAIVILLGISKVLSSKGINIFKVADQGIKKFLHEADKL